MSCVKHFAGYGAAEAGREYNTVDMSRGVLRDMYLEAYHAAVEAGCRLVMTAFNYHTAQGRMGIRRRCNNGLEFHE